MLVPYGFDFVEFTSGTRSLAVKARAGSAMRTRTISARAATPNRALSRRAIRAGASNDDSDERRLGWYFRASALEGQLWPECALTTAANVSNAPLASAGSSFSRFRSLVAET